MGKSKRFEETELWQSARFLVKAVYAISQTPKFSSDHGLVDQIRRAAVSIASNIAEGFDSQSNAVTCRYLASARGSSSEVRAQLYLGILAIWRGPISKNCSQDANLSAGNLSGSWHTSRRRQIPVIYESAIWNRESAIWNLQSGIYPHNGII